MKKYRVEYNMYGILSIMEDGEFNTATANSIICDTIPNVIMMLSTLGIDCRELENYNQ